MELTERSVILTPSIARGKDLLSEGRGRPKASRSFPLAMLGVRMTGGSSQCLGASVPYRKKAPACPPSTFTIWPVVFRNVPSTKLTIARTWSSSEIGRPVRVRLA
jgi:hypothetical protein